MKVRVNGRIFVDEHDRTVVLQGLNVCGNSKFPARPDSRSHIRAHFFDTDLVDFVGSPFNLSEAPEHFGRIKAYGFNTIRFLISWEALEHKGPGIYDERYIVYVIEILKTAKSFGLIVLMDPHQDAWSRFSGGSGAPMWTFHAAGLNPQAFQQTEAALIHNLTQDPSEFPNMIWTTNYNRLANYTMWTLFFAGKPFCPNAILDGVNIQEYLQQHFIKAFTHLASRISDVEELHHEPIIGWETLNEPSVGLIGYGNIEKLQSSQIVRIGTTPTPFECMLLGSGKATEISKYEMSNFGFSKKEKVLVDPQGVKIWLSPSEFDDSQYGWKRSPDWKFGECLWAQYGVWDPKSGNVLRPNYFSKDEFGTICSMPYFLSEKFIPFVRNYIYEIRQYFPNSILFLQPPVLAIPPELDKAIQNELRPLVYAPHYYDGLT